ncbi:MAG: hypothetical protein R2745_08095 [Vicinamibacterales bacterium]
MTACTGTAAGPTAPSAAAAGSTAAGADGSTLKVGAPRLVGPAIGASVTATPVLLVEPATGRFTSLIVTSARYQVSESATFASITDEGVAAAPAGGSFIAYTVQRAQRSGVKIYWRARVELDGAFGPWSATGEATVGGTTSGGGTGGGGGGGSRTPNPAPGQRLPLPNMLAQIQQWTAQRPDLFPSQQCPTGAKYVNNPWQDYIVDRLRQIDTRWGYNAKPTQTPANNNGRPVIAAGDEILYNWGSKADEGNTDEVYAVDMLTGHCGTAPAVTWRVFTGEEPVRWTGAGRF